MPCVRKLRALEPVRRKFIFAIRQIFSTKHPKREHLFWRELRAKSAVEIPPGRFCAKVNVALLHSIVDLNADRFHRASLDKLRIFGTSKMRTPSAGFSTDQTSALTICERRISPRRCADCFVAGSRSSNQ